MKQPRRSAWDLGLEWAARLRDTLWRARLRQDAPGTITGASGGLLHPDQGRLQPARPARGEGINVFVPLAYLWRGRSYHLREPDPAAVWACDAGRWKRSSSTRKLLKC